MDIKKRNQKIRETYLKFLKYKYSEIREKKKRGPKPMSMADLGRKYELSRAQIHHIVYKNFGNK